MNTLFLVDADFLKVHYDYADTILHSLEQYPNSFTLGTPRLGQIYLGIYDKARKSNQIQWSDKILSPFDFKENIVSSPWLYQAGLTTMPNTTGIIHDLSPISKALSSTQKAEYELSHRYSQGLCYYLANARKIVFANETVKSEFIQLFRSADKVPELTTLAKAIA